MEDTNSTQSNTVEQPTARDFLKLIYNEDDFSKSVGTAVAGVVGLLVSIFASSISIALFSAITAYPVARLVSSTIHNRVKRWSQERHTNRSVKRIYEVLTDEEINVLSVYVKHGGSVITWRQMNRAECNLASIESLIQRKQMWESITADGMTETFVVDQDLFDYAYKQLKV